MPRFFVLIAFLLLPSTLLANKISDVFSDSIFDVPWESSLSTVKSAHPGGKTFPGNDTVYTVKDGRTVFGIERDRRSEIIFGFDDADRLVSVGVNFAADDMPTLYNRLTTLFGPHEPPVGGYVIAEWPEDNGFIIRIFQIPPASVFGNLQILLDITYTPSTRPPISKEELGL